MDFGQELQREVRNHFKGHNLGQDLGQISTWPKDMGVNYLIRKAADAKTLPGCSWTRHKEMVPRKGHELGANARQAKQTACEDL